MVRRGEDWVRNGVVCEWLVEHSERKKGNERSGASKVVLSKITLWEVELVGVGCRKWCRSVLIIMKKVKIYGEWD